MLVLKELIFSSFYLEGVVVFKDLFCNSFHLWGGCGGVERTDSKNCFVTVSTYGEGVVVLKKLISTSFNFGGRVWWC